MIECRPMNEFKVGDRVLAVNAGSGQTIENGHVYVVTKISSQDIIWVSDPLHPEYLLGGYFADRFVPAGPEKAEPTGTQVAIANALQAGVSTNAVPNTKQAESRLDQLLALEAKISNMGGIEKFQSLLDKQAQYDRILLKLQPLKDLAAGTVTAIVGMGVFTMLFNFFNLKG